MPTRFNHMELTLPTGSLKEPERSAITRFYGEVFGWRGLDVKLIGANDLLLAVDEEVSQFILLVEQENPMHPPSFDHLGLLQETREEVDELLERCHKQRELDERVRIKEYTDLVQGDLTVHAFYVKYLLPIWLDVQVLSWKPGTGPTHRWSYS